MIIGANGQQMIRLGGDHVWRSRRIADVMVEYQWHNDEPSMILYRAVPTSKTGAFVIQMEDAHKYAESNGYPTPTLVKDAADCAVAIGLGHAKGEAYKVATIILDGLEDLLMMPPKPAYLNKPEPLANAMQLAINGEALH